jgi:cyclopropane fatty-acyl-phospholipid synthase-like methyltransferase
MRVNAGETERDRHQLQRALVEAGYDRMADSYLASKPPLTAEVEALLERLLDGLSPDAPVLDLGCGAGLPVTRWLAEHHPLTGVDLSAHQLELARNNVPGGVFIQADMTEVRFPAGSFGAMVAMHSIIHVPRENHAPLLRRVHGWLCPGGRFLATWPLSAWEGEETNWSGWGAPMWWSHFGAETYEALLREAAFSIEIAETLRAQDETWRWILARKATGDGG